MHCKVVHALYMQKQEIISESYDKILESVVEKLLGGVDVSVVKGSSPATTPLPYQLSTGSA